MRWQLGDFGLAVRESAVGGGRGSSQAAPRASSSAAAAGGGGGGGEVDMVGTYHYLAPEYRSTGSQSPKGDVYALGVSLLQLATGALERLHDLVPRVRDALAAGGGAAALLDARAGAWDVEAGERLLCLGLWAAAEAPDARPSSGVLAQELAKLWLATDQAAKLQASWQQAQQQPRPGSASSNGAAAAHAGGSNVGSSLAAAQAGGGGHGGGIGGFWRFLTATGPQPGRH
jgi:hypothetical protein